MAEKAITGGYSRFTTRISKKASKVFDKALQGLVGVGYTPLAVSTQVVAGTNYRFFCNARGVYPGALNEGAILDIYKPLKGPPHLTQIRIVT